MSWLLNKAKRLVQRPGSRGGKVRRTKTGQVDYHPASAAKYAIVNTTDDHFEPVTWTPTFGALAGKPQPVARKPRKGEFFSMSNGRIGYAHADDPVPGMIVPILKPRPEVLEQFHETGTVPPPTEAQDMMQLLREKLRAKGAMVKGPRVARHILHTIAAAPAEYIAHTPVGFAVLSPLDPDGEALVSETYDAAAATFGDMMKATLHLADAEVDAADEQDLRDALTNEMVKAVTETELKPDGPEPDVMDGETVLGLAGKGKKPVYASGADCKGYDDDDHHDAARLHHKAFTYHDELAKQHREMAEKDQDWKRSEEHHGEADRHEQLAEHHHGTSRDHLIAGGHGGSVEIGADGKAGELTPHDDDARAQAREGLDGRDHHAHPGGVGDRDRESYAGFAGDK